METSTLTRPSSRQRAKRTTRGRRVAAAAVDERIELEPDRAAQGSARVPRTRSRAASDRRP